MPRSLQAPATWRAIGRSWLEPGRSTTRSRAASRVTLRQPASLRGAKSTLSRGMALAGSVGDMIPIRDENPTLRTPIVTIAIIVVNALVWLIAQGAGTERALVQSICELGAIAGELTGRAAERAVELGPNAVCLLGSEPR